MTNETDRYLDFIRTTQRLKSTLRHAWTEDVDRQESTADHSWHMAMMAIAFSPNLVKKTNLEKVFQLIAIHDLGEAITGDIPAWASNHSGKADTEEMALSDIANLLPDNQKTIIIDLYKEYRGKESIEALFVKMLDIIDVLNQHLVSDVSTWSEEEWKFNVSRMSEKYFQDEPFMLSLYNEILQRLQMKIDKVR